MTYVLIGFFLIWLVYLYKKSEKNAEKYQKLYEEHQRLYEEESRKREYTEDALYLYIKTTQAHCEHPKHKRHTDMQGTTFCLVCSITTNVLDHNEQTPVHRYSDTHALWLFGVRTTTNAHISIAKEQRKKDANNH